MCASWHTDRYIDSYQRVKEPVPMIHVPMIHVLKPLLSYFAFKGTGTRDSSVPAEYVLSVGVPDDVTTWIYYDETDFVDRLWKAFVFSIRSHGMPKNITGEMMPWVREAEGKMKGLLNVRVKELEEKR